jgi:hypothetical protein
MRNKAEMAAWHQEQEELQRSIERRVEIARARPWSIRLPPDYHWGHCLLVVEGKTRISGRCAYSIEKNGDFSIQGPRQIYDDIDFPKATYGYEERSNDYWAEVFKDVDVDVNWTGYGNAEIVETHGAGPMFGPLRRHGSCLVGKTPRICLWKAGSLLDSVYRASGSNRGKRAA